VRKTGVLRTGKHQRGEPEKGKETNDVGDGGDECARSKSRIDAGLIHRQRHQNAGETGHQQVDDHRGGDHHAESRQGVGGPVRRAVELRVAEATVAAHQRGPLRILREHPVQHVGDALGPARDLGARGRRVEGEVELILPAKFESRQREGVITRLRAWVPFTKIGRMGRNLVGDHACLDVLPSR